MKPTHRLVVDESLIAMVDLEREGERFSACYLDPPYGTSRPDLGYDDTLRGSGWVDWLRPRLQSARRLLTPTGVMLMSVDEQHHAHARLLLEEVWSPRAHLGTVILDGASNPTARFVSAQHEYVLAFGPFDRLRSERVKWREPRPGASEILDAGGRAVAEHPGDDEAAERDLKAWWSGLPKSHPSRQKALLDYRMIRRGEVVRFGSLAKPHPHPAFEYDVHHPITGKPTPHPASGAWRWTQVRMQQAIAEGEVEFGPDESTPPRGLIRLRDVSTQPLPSVMQVRRGAGAKRLRRLVPDAGFAYPKDPAVIARLLRVTAPPDARVLDPFAGSGTTVDALEALNAADGGTRRAVLIEQDPSTAERIAVRRIEALGGDVEW